MVSICFLGEAFLLVIVGLYLGEQSTSVRLFDTGLL